MSEGAGDASGGATGVRPGALSALLQEVAAAPEQREAEAAPLAPGTVLGRFEIIRELGRGGFGVVYEARDRDLGRQVAVKVVRPGRIMEEEGKVSREAEAIARLAHPNLVTLHDVGRSERGPHLVFELLRGKTLDLRIQEGPLPVQEAVHIATEVARGLAHAHAEGVIHRDLKPANVFITNKGQVKILDFGMAHAFGRRRLSGGTPAYMAPEQWEDDPEDERTDVFALGVMLYRMLSGEYPFPEGKGKWAAEPATPRKLEVPGAPELADLVDMMLDRTPKGRPRDGAAVLAALTSIDEKLRARPADGSPPVHAKRRKATVGDLLAELKRRHVFRVMVGYGIFAFAVLQVTEPIMHGTHLPEWVLSVVLALLALGFPVAVVLAWIFDLTAQGVKRTPSASGPSAPDFGRSRFLLPLAVAAAVLAISLASAGGWYAWKRSAQHRPAPAVGDSPSIAVLPFKDLSPDHDQEYFSDGMTEEILSALAKVKGLRIPGRVSSFYFKGKNVEPGEIAQRLGVAHLLEGSVRRSGNKLRISAEVVRASDGERIWSQTFNRDLADVFAIQDEISRDVVEALRVKLLPGQPLPAKEYRPTSQDAYQSFLLGKHFARSYTRSSLTRAVAAFEKAVELDPAYASAWAGLADARIAAGMVYAVPWSEARRTALVAANRAAELGPDLPEALAARAQARLQEWDWAGAKADVDRALELGPENPEALLAMGSYLFQMGKDPVLPWRRVVELEPLDGRSWLRLGHGYFVAGQVAEADRAFARASEVDPDGAGASQRRWLIMQTRPVEALPLCQGTDRQVLSCKARAYHALGNSTEAQRALDALSADAQGDGIFNVAQLYAYLGQPDKAFDWLERARGEHVRALNGIHASRDLRALHADPRWAAFLRKMNLPVDDEEGTARSTTTDDRPSIAVLPFADMSAKHDQEYFADGVAEEIRNALSHVEGLKVIGRTSSFSLKGKGDDLRTIGEKLGASALLEGSVRRDGSRVRVAAEVVRAADGTSLWSQTFDRNLSRIFEVQAEIASAVVQALKVNRVASRSTSAQGKPTGSDEAYLLLLASRKDRASGTAGGLQEAAKKLKRALVLDPGYAAAWAALADVLRMQSEEAGSGAELAELRKAAANATGKALSLDPDLAVAYVQRSTDRTWVLDWDGARADAGRARTLDPLSPAVRSWSSVLEDAVGTPASVLATSRAQVDADPLNPQVWMGLGWALLRSGRFEEAKGAFRKALDVSPGSPTVRYQLACAHLLRREPEKALQALAEIPEGNPLRLIATAMANHTLGRKAESQAALQELVARWSFSGAYNVAQVHAWRGEPGPAFDWLHRAMAQQDSALPWLRNDPILRSLHADPRWKPFLKRMNLPAD